MTRRDIEIITNLIVLIISAVELAKRSGPSFDFHKAVDDAVEEAVHQLEV